MAARRRKKDQQPEEARGDAYEPPSVPPDALAGPWDGATGALAQAEPVKGTTTEPPRPASNEKATKSTAASARHPGQTINLGPTNDSPKMRLTRSEQYQQMQMSFDEKPAADHRARLRDAGWTWRDAEQIWTIQLDRGARWRTQADAERLFVEIGNAIRAEQGLEPVSQLGR